MIPSPFKWIFASFMAILVPTYWIVYGPTNFLWFSDTILLLAFFAVLLESSLLASMAAVGGIILESFWVIDFLLLLLFNVKMTGLTYYMFDPSYALGLRILSLFHLGVLPLVVWLVFLLGYQRRAWIFQTFFVWMVLVASRLFSHPSKNINWVYCYKKISWLVSRPWTYLVLEGLGISMILALTHFLLVLAFRKLASMGLSSHNDGYPYLLRWDGDSGAIQTVHLQEPER